MSGVMEMFQVSPEEQIKNNQYVSDFNKSLGRKPQQQLGQDDFLKLLLTQLSHQDPTAPMQDKEFIAQMAQFSSLQEMTSMNKQITGMAADFSKLASMLAGSEVSSVLGKNVELVDGDKTVQGVVKAVTREENPRVMVDGVYYNWTQVNKVFDE
jgi:flagellar basal-body rod modification protein FlgD